MHKTSKKEALEARLLKPSLSGNSLKYDESSKRASGGKLDLDAPLLSGRKNLTVPESASVSAKVGRSGSNLSRRPLVPFFTWEQHQAVIPGDQCQSRGKKKVEASKITGLILAPPPRPQQQIVTQRDGKSVDCSDARSEFAYTDHASVAPTYVVSNLVENEEDWEDEPLTEYNAADREMILQRFLPAAKALAIEMSSRIEDDSGRPVIVHPSPQVHYRRQKVVEKVEKKSFGEFLSVQQEGSVVPDDHSGPVDRNCSSHFISDSACGFFPLLRMLQTSTSGCKQHKQDERARAVQEANGDKSSGEEEWFSDQGGEEESYEQLQLQAAYMACKYTPSRGGLKSPAIAESKGFLGMPRDRAGRTYIKRMYPVAEVVSRRQQENSDADSVSSESLSSIKLEKRSAANSRQSSNGGEKVFCLDTLNQVRAGAAEQRKSFFIGGEETVITVVDECGDHPKEAASPILYRSKKKTKKKLQLKERMMETLKHRRMLRGSEELGESYYDREDEDEEEEDEDDELKTLSELRICWHEDDDSHKVLLPTPRGPAQSWLKKKLVQAQKAELANAALRKPPLARKPLAQLAISFGRQRF